MVAIKKQLVAQKKYGIKCPYEMKPIGICVHNTANDAPAKNEISYMISNDNETSFHYAVDDIEAIQGVLLSRNTWHAGDGANGIGNRKYISVEICYSKSGGVKFEKAEKNGAWLVAYLLNEYNWDISKVKKHQDFSKKYCPHRTLNLGWKRFINMVSKELDGLQAKKAVTVKKTPSNTTEQSLYKINTSVLNVRKGPSTSYAIVTSVKKNEVYTIVEVKNNWGKLKSGVGWISLSYAIKMNKTDTIKAKKPKKTNTQIAKEVINGIWGNGNERKIKLQNAGYDYQAIQKIVNKLV